jgi:alpha-ribazole phosphatase/probable phosphoglycerate mutase
MEIIFESHSTTLDNESGQAAGWYDVALSEAGEQQAKQLGERRRAEHFDTIFCSDLQRSYLTAKLAFGDTTPIVQDARLRECNYGELNRAQKSLIDQMKPDCIDTPYPGGESWQQAADRVGEFLGELQKRPDLKRVLIIGHRATQYGLEVYCNGERVREIALAPWQYQPGWRYELPL